MIFDVPEVNDFFDNRLVISWTILQPKEFPSLKRIQFSISGEPELVFEPNQSAIIEIPALEDNTIIINWVVVKPKEKTDIFISLSCPTIEETQKIVFNP
ncbi:MAG: hypothetical protein ACTSQ9_07625 [Candidatus Hodarchaeales archaeon]